MCDTLIGMAVDRLSITVGADLGRAAREAATAGGVSLSSWVAEAIEERVRQVSLATFLDDWQAEHGAFTEEQLDRARRTLAGEVDPQRVAS